MKRYKPLLATFGIGGIIILSAAFGIFYIRETQDLQALRQELTAIEARSAKVPKPVSTNELSAQQVSLETDLKNTKTELLAAGSKLVFSGDSIDTTDIIIVLGQKNRISNITFKSPGWQKENQHGYSFSTLSLTVTGEGEVADLVRFVSAITSRFPTLEVFTSSMTVPKPDAKGAAKPPVVTITMSIFNFEGK